MTTHVKLPKEATIYIPRGRDHLFGIDAGSGIVGSRTANGEIVVLYYEGNRYGAVNLFKFEERIVCAAGRLFTRYPTIAMIGLSSEDVQKHFMPVGRIGDNYEISWDDRNAAYAYGDSQRSN